jgi:hypothetical protein
VSPRGKSGLKDKRLQPEICKLAKFMLALRIRGHLYSREIDHYLSSSIG